MIRIKYRDVPHPANELEQIIQITDGEADIYDIYVHRPTSTIALDHTNGSKIESCSFRNKSITLREILLLHRIPPSYLVIKSSIKNMSTEHILDTPVSNIGITKGFIYRKATRSTTPE